MWRQEAKNDRGCYQKQKIIETVQTDIDPIGAGIEKSFPYMSSSPAGYIRRDHSHLFLSTLELHPNQTGNIGVLSSKQKLCFRKRSESKNCRFLKSERLSSFKTVNYTY